MQPSVVVHRIEHGIRPGGWAHGHPLDLEPLPSEDHCEVANHTAKTPRGELRWVFVNAERPERTPGAPTEECRVVPVRLGLEMRPVVRPIVDEAALQIRTRVLDEFRGLCLE